jgi:peroxiredoxin
MTPARRWVAAGLAAGAAGLLAVKFLRAAGERALAMREEACGALEPSPLPAPLRGQDAPDFALPDRTGRAWSLKSLRGRPVLLNFWFTTCPPCIEEMPGLEHLRRRLGDSATILAVSVDEEGWPAIEKFFGAAGTGLSVLLDQKKDVSKLYGVDKFPETFLIDPAGKVRKYFVNKKTWGSAEAALCVESVR